jgi:hypothetical protein
MRGDMSASVHGILSERGHLFADNTVGNEKGAFSWVALSSLTSIMVGSLIYLH